MARKDHVRPTKPAPVAPPPAHALPSPPASAPDMAPPSPAPEISRAWWLVVVVWLVGFGLLLTVEMIGFVGGIVRWLTGGAAE